MGIAQSRSYWCNELFDSLYDQTHEYAFDYHLSVWDGVYEISCALQVMLFNLIEDLSDKSKESGLTIVCDSPEVFRYFLFDQMLSQIL